MKRTPVTAARDLGLPVASNREGAKKRAEGCKFWPSFGRLGNEIRYGEAVFSVGAFGYGRVGADVAFASGVGTPCVLQRYRYGLSLLEWMNLGIHFLLAGA